MTTTRQRIALGFLVVPSFMLLGVFAGSTIAVLRETSSMGIDQLANTLGGAMIGLIIGVTVAIVALSRLPVRTLVITAVIALALAVALMVIGRSRAKARRAARQAARWELPDQPPLAIPLRSSAFAASLS